MNLLLVECTVQNFRDNRFNMFLQFVYEHMISVTVLASIILYLLWNLTRLIFSLFLTGNQRVIANTLQEFLNSVLITVLIVFFVFNIQRREFSYFSHLSLISNGIIKTTASPYKILYANQQLLDLLNYSDIELIDQSLKTIYDYEAQLKLNNFMNNTNIKSIKKEDYISPND